VGIGTSSPASGVRLHVSGGKVRIDHNTALEWGGTAYSIVGNATTGFLQFNTASTERARIDASGNLLVGKTTTAFGTQGIRLEGSNGKIELTRTNNVAFAINRLSSDGDLAQFAKDGTTVGSISTAGGDIEINSATGNSKNASILGRDSGGNSRGIVAGSGSARPNADNVIDLGTSTARFKDLYLSGGVYLGGTAGVNLLNDYEYGDYAVTLTPSGGGSITVAGSHNDLKYTKIGSRVFVSGKVDVSAVSSPTGYITVTLPFVIHNSGTANDSRRFNGSIWVINSALNTYEFQLYGIEGESAVRIYNGSGAALDSTAAQQFSGDEGICFNFHYETTP
jgi:hypothetical protein